MKSHNKTVHSQCPSMQKKRVTFMPYRFFTFVCSEISLVTKLFPSHFFVRACFLQQHGYSCAHLVKHTPIVCSCHATNEHVVFLRWRLDDSLFKDLLKVSLIHHHSRICYRCDLDASR